MRRLRLLLPLGVGVALLVAVEGLWKSWFDGRLVKTTRYYQGHNAAEWSPDEDMGGLLDARTYATHNVDDRLRSCTRPDRVVPDGRGYFLGITNAGHWMGVSLYDQFRDCLWTTRLADGRGASTLVLADGTFVISYTKANRLALQRLSALGDLLWPPDGVVSAPAVRNASLIQDTPDSVLALWMADQPSRTKPSYFAMRFRTGTGGALWPNPIRVGGAPLRSTVAPDYPAPLTRDASGRVYAELDEGVFGCGDSLSKPYTAFISSDGTIEVVRPPPPRE